MKWKIWEKTDVPYLDSRNPRVDSRPTLESGIPPNPSISMPFELIAGLPEKVEKLETRMDKMWAVLSEQIEALEQHNHPSIPTQDEEAHKKVDDAHARIRSIYETLKWHGESFRGIEGRVDRIDNGFGKVEEELEEIKTALRGLIAMFSQLSNYPTELARRIRAIEGKMGLEQLFQSRRNQEWSINQHMDTLRGYASQCKHITEFGTESGFSTIALLCGKPDKLITYDIVRSDENIELIEGVARDYTDTDFIFNQESSLEIEIEETDLLFIDTEHTYKQLSQELTLHSDKVRKFIILHDTEESADELQPAIREWLEDNSQWYLHEHFKYQYGLSIFRRR